MAFSGNQRTRHGNYGGARAPYGSFAGKVIVVDVATYPGAATFASLGPGSVATAVVGPASVSVASLGPGSVGVGQKTS